MTTPLLSRDWKLKSGTGMETKNKNVGISLGPSPCSRSWAFYGFSMFFFFFSFSVPKSQHSVWHRLLRGPLGIDNYPLWRGCEPAIQTPSGPLNLSHREGLFTFVYKSFCQDWYIFSFNLPLSVHHYNYKDYLTISTINEPPLGVIREQGEWSCMA